MNPGEGRKRRELEPTHTMGYVHVPLLREKLGWLYGWHPVVKTQYILAREMGVSPATLSSWLNGKRYSDSLTVAVVDPDSIPKKYFQQFLDVWALAEDTMQAPDLAQFKTALQDAKIDRRPWDRLVAALIDDERIEILVNVARGLIDPDETYADGIPQFRPGDALALRVKNPRMRHGVMLLQDRTGWSSLRPTPQARSTEVDGDLIFPRQLAAGPMRFAQLDATIGMHRVLVLLMDDVLPPGVINVLLARPVDAAGLNQIAPLLQKRLADGVEKSRMLSRRFIVTNATKDS